MTATKLDDLWTLERAEAAEVCRRVRCTGVLSRGMLYLCDAPKTDGEEAFWKAVSEKLRDRAGLPLDDKSTVGVSQHLAQHNDRELFGFCILHKRSVRAGDKFLHCQKFLFWCSSQQARKAWITSLVACIQENRSALTSRPPSTRALISELLEISHTCRDENLAKSGGEAVSQMLSMLLRDGSLNSERSTSKSISAAAQVT